MTIPKAVTGFLFPHFFPLLTVPVELTSLFLETKVSSDFIFKEWEFFCIGTGFFHVVLSFRTGENWDFPSCQSESKHLAGNNKGGPFTAH